MPSLHPTAVVDPKAKLADDVVVGPYCVVGPDVEIGPGCRLDSHVIVSGRTRLGADNRVWSHAAIGGEPQDLKYQGEPTELVIGDHNDIREFVTIHVGTANGGGVTKIGSHNLLMVAAHVAHDCNVGDHCVIANNVLLAGHVHVEDYATVSGGAALHHFVSVGRYAFVGGNSGVVRDCPPYMICEGQRARVRGVNEIGLHRHDFAEDRIDRLREVFRLLYMRDEGNQAEAITALRGRYSDDPLVLEVCDFAARAAVGRHGRYRESLRHDNKRRSPAR